MLQIVGIIFSSLFLNISQPLTLNNGWTLASAASSHCACACCKGGGCHCGMDKKLPPVSSNASKPLCPCCGKANHFPEQPTTPILGSAGPSSNDLVKSLKAARAGVSFFDVRKPQTNPPLITVSPPGDGVISFPLRV
jgi:hypothetical protein